MYACVCTPCMLYVNTLMLALACLATAIFWRRPFFFAIARARESDALSVISTQRRGRRFVRLCMLAAFVAWYLMCRVVLACV